MRRDSFGFSLIELMVVMGIIAVILTISMVSITNIKAQNRDKERKADVAEYQLAIRLYYEQNGDYPDYPNGVQLGVGNTIDAQLSPFLPSLPQDPDGSSQYWYDSAFDCNGKVGPVIFTTNMEMGGNSNFATRC